MMVTIYGIFVKKKSELLLIQQKKDAIFEQGLAMSQVELQNQALKYVGQELHDDLGQKLSVARLMTNNIMQAPTANNQKNAEEINQLIGECIQDIRNISRSFIVQPAETFDLVESLEKEVKRIQRLCLLEVDYKNNHHFLKIDPEHGIILFRIIQECITNVIKHSRSRTLQLIVEDRPRQIKFFINDKGVGLRNNRYNKGIGLKNIMSRAELINADFKINSAEENGTQITLTYKK